MERGRKGRLAVLLVIPLVLMTDQMSASVLKPLIARLRPSITLPDVHLLGKKMSSYSFPSSHASNFFGLATYFSYLYSRYKWWFFSCSCPGWIIADIGRGPLSPGCAGRSGTGDTLRVGYYLGAQIGYYLVREA